MKIAMVSVYVPDPLEAFEFYTGVLGFEERMRVPEMKLAIVGSPEDRAGVGLLLEPNENPIASTYQQALYENGFPAIVLSSEQIETDYERLVEAGVVFRSPPTTNEWGTSTVFEDGFGNLIQLHQVP